MIKLIPIFPHNIEWWTLFFWFVSLAMLVILYKYMQSYLHRLILINSSFPSGRKNTKHDVDTSCQKNFSSVHTLTIKHSYRYNIITKLKLMNDHD